MRAMIRTDWVNAFACHDASCQPPPHGTGGTNSGRVRGNPIIAKGMQDAADRREEAHLAKIQARRDATMASVGKSKPTPVDDDKAPIIHSTYKQYPITRDVLKNGTNMFLGVANSETMSGWKAHVFATDIPTTVRILERLAKSGKLATEGNEGGWGAKVATQAFHDYTRNGHKQAGKGVTIYFPNRATAERDMAELVKMMEGLPGGKITGDEMRSSNVGVRYELKPGAPDRDLEPHEYRNWYQEA